MVWRLGVALLCVLTCNSSAQNITRKAVENSAVWEPPAVIEFPQSAKATVPKEMIRGLRVSGVKIVLEVTELEAVERQVGGTIGHRGDAGDSLSWLCLHGFDPKGKWVLWLMSSEIDGATVGGFRWQRLERKATLDARCQTLPDGQHSVELPVILRLGTTEEGVQHILGPPTTRVENADLYLHEHEGTIRNEPFTMMNKLAVVLHRGVVWAIEAWKSTTS